MVLIFTSCASNLLKWEMVNISMNAWWLRRHVVAWVRETCGFLYLDVWFPVVRIVWEGFGDVALFEDVWLWWRRYVSGDGLWSFTHPNLLSHACVSKKGLLATVPMSCLHSCFCVLLHYSHGLQPCERLCPK